MSAERGLGGLPIAAGDVLLKKYRVEGLIGEGGTSVVVSAKHVQLEQRVAIKFLRRSLADDELRTRFEREARAIGKIESDHVVTVLDTGALEDGSPFMVLEHLEGRDLAKVVKEDGPLPIERAVDCMLQVCEALAEAHAIGIVHRDLKPANLLLTRTDDDHVHVKVLDFGISKFLDKKLVEGDGGTDEVTSAYTVLGSPRWMAPEQIRNSRDVDGRADLWSVGAVLFKLVTGQHAFDAEGNVQASLAVLTAEPRRLTALAPHAPAALEVIVSKCLTKDVACRWQTATELAEALLPFASERAKDSLDRLRNAKLAPSVKIAVGISPMSTPPDAFAAGRLPQGKRDAPTERRMRASDPDGAAQAQASAPRSLHIEPRTRPSRPSPPAGTASKATLAVLGAGAFALVLGGIMAVRFASETGLLRGPSEPASAARFSAERAPAPPLTATDPAAQPDAVPLDAGERDP